jgi:hypothetical protein
LSDDAVIVATPLATAVAMPVLSIVKTPELLDVQVMTFADVPDASE